jgi:deaminated glutathione amidase
MIEGDSMKIAALQMSSGDDVDENLASAEKLITRAAKQGASVVSLPENFALMPNKPDDLISCAKQRESDIDNVLSAMAAANQVFLLSGSFPAVSPDKNRIYGSCRAYNEQGERVARYDKMHLFDVTISSDEAYRESDYTFHGAKVAVVDSPAGAIGLSICYDMRFPELYRLLSSKGADILNIPSAFTVPTGRAHWQVLLRARAIENQAFVIAPAQVGTHPSGRKTYGHSMIINPWGDILACNETELGLCVATIDKQQLADTRRRFPSLTHRRIADPVLNS